MKKFILPAFLFFSLVMQAQRPRDMYSNIELVRINLKEKLNLPARYLPKLLIQAYCEGKIKAYYPFNVNKECSYYEFASHFAGGKTQPIPGADEFSNINCPASFCIAGDDELMKKFQDHVELFQVKRFDKNLSTEVYDIKYIRIKFIKEKYDQVFDFQGPVFYFEDVIALGEEYKLPNPKNDAAQLTFKQFLQIRQWNGVVINDELNNGNRPKVNDKNKQDNKEKDNWHN
ncbi:MAG: hypothetical protein ACJ76F_03010 [Bacteroidia bacterium]